MRSRLGGLSACHLRAGMEAQRLRSLADAQAASRDGLASVLGTLLKVGSVNPFMPTVPTFAVRETASLSIMGVPRVPPLNPSETIVLSEHYRL